MRSRNILLLLVAYIIILLPIQDNARVGDAFMDQIETIAGYIPYMATPGNHENA